ncbi:MAG: D-amino acid dehydrogenase small subunit [Euryarchaeota archaeon ADurb.BinA087]|nr:MAG: D-amino acid dehydrogenase small subunit [Euryarchaeota archaeon ADurb.BinA087]
MVPFPGLPVPYHFLHPLFSMAIVVGSGAGGATVAKELAAAGHRVVILEKGPAIAEVDAHRYYENVDTGVKLMRTCCLGGTTMVSAGNALRCLEKELLAFGIDLSAEFAEAEQELRVRKLPDELIGEGTRRLIEAASRLGLPVRKMPKFIDPVECCRDGRCSLGCPVQARWNAVRFVECAQELGADLVTGQAVTRIVTHAGRVTGVRCGSRIYHDDLVVIAAGALETPRLLAGIGIPTSPLFCDTFASIGGVCPGVGFHQDVPMGAYVPHSSSLILTHYARQFVTALKAAGHDVREGDILGMMVKIRDEASGSVGETIEKGVTEPDSRRLACGASIAGAILAEAGADPATFVSLPLRGSHPGGTARIGVSVDTRLMTRISGLYVVDASVLPATPGAPPILTIIALAKYAAKRM